MSERGPGQRVELALANWLAEHAPAEPALAGAATALLRALRGGHTAIPAPAYLKAPIRGDDGSLLLSDGDQRALFVARDGLLQSWRHYRAEQRIASALRRLLGRSARPLPVDDATLDALDPDQRAALHHAANSALTLLTGGPGSGKTTVLAAIAQCYAATAGPERVAIAAPTGKAVARIRELFDSRAGPPVRIETLHRLLGAGALGHGFRHGREHPLALDALIVDEASMLDLELADRLLAALPSTARLVLVGDPEQLDAVETSGLLRALHPSGAPLPALGGHAVRLAGAHRAADPLRLLAFAVARGDAAALGAALDREQVCEGPALPALLRTEARRLVEIASNSGQADQALAAVRQHALLCLLRRGPRSQQALGAAIEDEQRRLLGLRAPLPWFPGRLVLVTVNDHPLQLYNGDLGLTLVDAQGQARVWFQGPAGLRALLPEQLPPHQSGAALTVHRAQGSEFDAVTLVLPDGDHPLLSRPLLYTAITRARRSLRILGGKEQICRALARIPERLTGLARHLAD